MKRDPESEPARSKQSWRLFLVVEGVVLLLVVAATWVSVTTGGTRGVALVLALGWMWLIITIPICCCYLLGHPVVISLSPLVPSAESRTFLCTLRNRTPMTHDQFYEMFYATSDIPKPVIVGVRNCLITFHPIADRLVPADDLTLLDDELDLAEVLRWMNQEFRVQFSQKDYASVDGTLDNLIRVTHRKVQAMVVSDQ